MKWLMLISLSILSGCATGYHPVSFAGGYKEMSMGKDLFQVSFHGNGYTSSSTVHTYFLRRCAELTIEQGYDYFLIIDKNNSTDLYSTGTNTSGSINPNGYGGYNYSANTSSGVVSKASSEGTIKLFKEGSQPPVAVDAHIFIKNFKD